MTGRLSRALCSVTAGLVLVACTGGSAPGGFGSPAAALSASGSVSPTPIHRHARPGAQPGFPTVRWDLVPRGPLPATCTARGVPVLVFAASGQVYATGPGLTCGNGPKYWVRALVKVGVYGADGRWTYPPTVKPSAPALGKIAAQRSDMTTCTAGVALLPVASFVVLWPDGHQLRYKVVGAKAVCR